MTLSGSFFDYFLVFWGGVLVSFSPCVYPVMPITASFIAGVNTQGSRLHGFVISLIYVLGLAVTYSAMGVIAVLTGKFFGQIQNNPIVFLIVGNIFIIFALVLFDFIQIPSLKFNWQNHHKPKNIWTIFLFGMAAGLIVGPCTAPILGSVLAHVAAKQNLIYGISLLIVFSYGVGASLILIGTFSGILAALPKSGPWLLGIKRLTGLILFIFGEYYLIKAGGLLV